jgi:hypothetical protein
LLPRPLHCGRYQLAGLTPHETFSCKADSKSRVCVRQSYYSVPARYAGRRVAVRLGARQVEMFADGARIAARVRAVHKYSSVVELNHYLDVLTRKPGALASASALVAAWASGAFTPLHQRFWDKARVASVTAPKTRALIEVLLLARTLPQESLSQAVEQAIAAADFDPEHVAVSARRQHSTRLAGAMVALPTDIEERLAHLPARVAPSLACYDKLLATVGGDR